MSENKFLGRQSPSLLLMLTRYAFLTSILYYPSVLIDICLELANGIGVRILRNCFCYWNRSYFIASRGQGCNRARCAIETSDEYESGHYNLCPHMVFAAAHISKVGGVNPLGTLCKYYKSP